MIYGYARCTTQNVDLLVQIEALRKAGCEKTVEETLAGIPKERPALTALLDQIRPGDVVMSLSLDSLCYSLSHLVQLMNRLQEKQVRLVILQEEIDTGKEIGIYSLFEKLAKVEKELKKEKAGTGLQSAKVRGRKGGRKKGLSQDAEHKAILAESYYKQGKLGVDEISQKLKIAKSTLYRYLRHQGVEI